MDERMRRSGRRGSQVLAGAASSVSVGCPIPSKGFAELAVREAAPKRPDRPRRRKGAVANAAQKASRVAHGRWLVDPSTAVTPSRRCGGPVEYDSVGEIDTARPFHQSQHSGTIAEGRWVQFAEQPQTKEGSSHPIATPSSRHQRESEAFQRRGQPVSRTRKKELVGESGGRDGSRRAIPRKYSCTTLWTGLGKAIPYGVYDITENQGWVSVGIDHEPRGSLPRLYADGGGWARSGTVGRKSF